ncbi:MAG: hypothetical protein ABR586_06960, partial [Thermoplasmatota archaeon]
MSLSYPVPLETGAEPSPAPANLTALVALPPLPSPLFTLRADSIEAEVYVADTAVHGGVVVHAPNTGVERYSLTAATVQGSEVRKGYWVSVFPLGRQAAPQWEESSLCIHASASSATSLRMTGNAGAPVYTADVDGAVAWLPLCDVQVARHIRGDFLMTLWQCDAVAQSPEGTQVLRSGETPKAPEEEAPGYPFVAVTTDRQVILTVQGGDLLLPALSTADAQIYLYRPQVHALGNVVLHDAKGFLAVRGETVDAKEVVLSGDLLVKAGQVRNGTTLPLEVDWAPATQGTTVADLPSHSLAWLWLLCLPALAAVP